MKILSDTASDDGTNNLELIHLLKYPEESDAERGIYPNWLKVK